jgi:glycogen phosphorylase
MSEVRKEDEVRVEDDRTGMHPLTLEHAVLDHLYYTCGKDKPTATLLDVFQAVAHAARDRLVQRWMQTKQAHYDGDVKRVYYMSGEFLLGRSLALNLINLGLYEPARKIARGYGLEIDQILEREVDPGLGNGGLGRLAACFMESMATLGLPAVGYGIRYEFGIFDQLIEGGRQVERGDAWLRYGNPWEFPRHEYTVPVNFNGRVIQSRDEDGVLRTKWIDTQKLLGVPYDMPVAGYGTNTVNTLRLWSARASREFNFQVFNDGDYRRAVEEKSLSESISKVLYPNDQSPEGRDLRLKQQYFFVSCSIFDIIRRYKKTHANFDQFPDKVAIQLNDTHPSIAIPELMRVFLDQEDMPWEKAWELTREVTAYTNHTLLPEALERWPVSMFERLLPRHLQIIYEINHRFLRRVHIFRPNDYERQRRMSIIAEGPEKQVRMAHLAVVGSHSVNGVAALHTRLIKSQLMPDFAEMWPELFNNKTNGVTPRRWLLLANPRLAHAITTRIGEGWVTKLTELEGLVEYQNDNAFQEEVRGAKAENKRRLAAYIRRTLGVQVNVESIFDIHVKRLHEYKRQLLNCLHIVSIYRTLKENPGFEMAPRTFIFGGKAAPGYTMAKLHIQLINAVADVVNADPTVRDRIKVVFIPNYGVSLAEIIIPAADVSEQISTAGKEASGTGNMKFTMNGALTVGTLDGANIEIREEVGAENFFLFGLTAEQIAEIKAGGYDPREYIAHSERLRDCLDFVASGFFSPEQPDLFHPVIDSLVRRDEYMLCADFDDYVACHRRVEEAFGDSREWTRRAICNIAKTGKFSSDRAINEYAREIWGLTPLTFDLKPPYTPKLY